MRAPTRALCALCEQRFMRSSLPGVVVMKRVCDLRRKWGVIQDSKKLHSPSLLYGTANVCLLCQEILAYEDTKKLSKPANGKTLNEQQSESLSLDSKIFVDSKVDKDIDIGRMIHDSIMHRWHQQPTTRNNDSNLEDIAVNKRVRQSSTVFNMKAQNALDPDITRSAHTKEEFQPWWEIDLGNYVEVHSVKVYLRDEVSHLYSSGRGITTIPGRHTPGVYPLHISISMRSGVGRDCGDNIASCVSSLCVTDKMSPLIEWVAPCKSRMSRCILSKCISVTSNGRGIATIPGRHTPGVYPLHISISMRSGVGRDCGDNIASCVSSLCVTDKMSPLIEWVAPCKSRGRFVRIQCEGRAILHTERVQVYAWSGDNTFGKNFSVPPYAPQHLR
ncbi:Hypothetical protein PHPALM_17748 [Phytophthora palmivora]|uniref:Fucolectin tachylectin-4 pentraxin-1 domain-containing protein n=1 Tax=Phytophthora palmivora TaxID=4796 RepID=A0A2P4XLF5_9STRA|nr:Hypothetical protein PHPALM_17748 [Phytophthora palmivora]